MLCNNKGTNLNKDKDRGGKKVIKECTFVSPIDRNVLS
jgi:hypothetical protein